MRTHKAGVLISILLIVAFFLPPAFGQENANPATKKKSSAETMYSEIGKAPEKARAKRNPLEKDPNAVAAGRILFEQRCAECHGDNAEGGKKGPSLRAAEIQNAEPGAIFWILTNGVVRKGMPVWSKIPEPQRWQLVSFIKSLGPCARKNRAAARRYISTPGVKDSPSRPR
jgi:mono/diheme cytochrome c family protein